MLEAHQRMMQKSLPSWIQELKSSSLRKAMVGPIPSMVDKSVGSPPNTSIKRIRKRRIRMRTNNNKKGKSLSQRIMFAFDLDPEPRTKCSNRPLKDKHTKY